MGALAQLRLEPAEPMSPAALAHVFRRTIRTVNRWLAYWFSAGVRAVQKVAGRGRYGFRYVASAEIVQLWQSCELPPPFGEPLPVPASVAAVPT